MNQKYILLNESLEALKKGSINLLVLKGSPGTGKSRTTLDFLKNKQVNFNYFSSYSTPLYFYKLLYENREKEVLIFDDIEGINDLKIIAMLKSLCWSPEGIEREVCYFSTSDKISDYSLPDRFTTKARIILIFNNCLRGFEPIINRGICLDFNFSFKEKLDVFEEMKDKAKIDEDVLNYVKTNCNESTENLNLRSLVILSNLKRDGFDFKKFAREILNCNDDVELIINLVSKSQSLNRKKEEICNEWMNLTGQSRATFFRILKRLNL